MLIESSVFTQNSPIPVKFTCDGENLNPPLTFSDIPGDAKSLTLLLDDPDAPGQTFSHWVLYNIPPGSMGVAENTVPDECLVGNNGSGTPGYIGPCPPSGQHRYIFTLAALDRQLDVSAGATKDQVESKMEGHIIATAQLTGLYPANPK